MFKRVMYSGHRLTLTFKVNMM